MLRLNGRQLFLQLLEEHRFFVPPADIGDEGVQDRGYCTRIGAGPSAGYAICAQQDWGAPALQSDPLFENAKVPAQLCAGLRAGAGDPGVGPLAYRP